MSLFFHFLWSINCVEYWVCRCRPLVCLAWKSCWRRSWHGFPRCYFSSVIRSAAALLRCASLILLPPVLLQSSLQIEFLCGVDSCFRSSVSHQNLLVNRALGHDASWARPVSFSAEVSWPRVIAARFSFYLPSVWFCSPLNLPLILHANWSSVLLSSCKQRVLPFFAAAQELSVCAAVALVPAFSSVLVDTSSFVVSDLVKICCREKPVLVLSYRIKKLEVSEYLSFLHGGFSNIPVSCSVKCMRGLELPFDSFWPP
jgi:hypothetical protein